MNQVTGRASMEWDMQLNGCKYMKEHSLTLNAPPAALVPLTL